MSIELKLKELAEARAARDEAKQIAKDALDSFMATDELYKSATERARIMAGQAEELEADVKAWALANFDGANKKVHPCVTIKTFDISRAVYDPTTAFIWCLSNFTPALRLDAKTFEKAALSGTIPTEIALVVPEQENRAQIATDLSDLL